MDSIEVVIRQPGFPDRVIPLQEGRVRLGRADDNEIVLSDVGVSRRHAQIVVSGGQVTVEDLGSGNGTYYFGHRVKSQVMRDQDEVVIDPFILQFQIKGAAPAVAPPQVLSSPTDGPRIEVVVGNGMVGNLFPIVDGKLTMGRAEDRDVVVPDAASSRHHCHITEEGGEYVLHDNGSANGVFVNAVRVRECTLSNGDLVRIGNTEMRFVHPAVAQAPTMDLAAAQPPPSPVGSIPIEPSNDPVQTVLKSDPEDDDEAPSGSNTSVILAAVAGLLSVAVVAVLLVVGLAGLMWYVSDAAVEPIEIAERGPTWVLELPALPASTNDELNREGTEATKAYDYKTALQSFYRVLQAQPGDVTAKKFSAFAGEMMVIEALEKDLGERLVVERERVKRRSKLLAHLRSSNNRRRTEARRILGNEFREDPVVRAYNAENPREFSGPWGDTIRQQAQRDQLQKMEREVQTEQYEKAIRTGQRLLEDSNDADLRQKTWEQLALAETALAEKVAVAWRSGVMAETLGDKEIAMQDYKRLLTVNQHNRSATLRLEALKAQP